MAYKVFTNGSTLQASEVNDNLMKQAVATFSNAAARTAAITAPVEGQMTYLEDVDRYDHWNGSAWVSPFGLTKLATASFSAQTSVSVNNVFTSVYDNYKLVLNITAKSANSGILFRFRAAGSDNTTANYNYGFLGARTSAANFNVGQAGGTLILLSSGNTFITNVSADIYFPNTTQWKALSGTGFGGDASTWMTELIGGNLTSTTAFDGFSLISESGTFTGSLAVYGYRK